MAVMSCNDQLNVLNTFLGLSAVGIQGKFVVVLIRTTKLAVLLWKMCAYEIIIKITSH